MKPSPHIFAKPSNSGFTLIELLIAIVVLSLLSGIFYVRFDSYAENFTINSEAEKIISHLHTLRYAAIMRRQNIKVIIASDGLKHVFRHPTNGYTGAEYRQDLDLGVRLAAVGNTFFYFTSDGFAVPAKTLELRSISKLKKLTINSLGYITPFDTQEIP